MLLQEVTSPPCLGGSKSQGVWHVGCGRNISARSGTVSTKALQSSQIHTDDKLHDAFSKITARQISSWHYKAETQFCSLLQRRPFIVPFVHKTLSIFCCFQHCLSTAVLQHSLSKAFLETKWRQCTYRNVIHCFIKAGPWFWIVLRSFTDRVFSYTPEHMKLIL